MTHNSNAERETVEFHGVEPRPVVRHKERVMVPIAGVWLRRSGDKIQVLVEMQDGKWHVAIEEDARANFSYASHAESAYKWPEDPIRAEAEIELPSDWEKLPAGREMDRLVALFITRYPQSQGWTGDGKFVKGDPIWLNRGGFPSTCPRYSTEVQAAMKVVSALKDLGYAFAFWDSPGGLSEGVARCGFRPGARPPEQRGDDDAAYGYDDDLALAICKAALCVYVLRKLEASVRENDRG